jgi:hypothetical protein
MRSAGVVSFTLTAVTVFVMVFRVVDISGLRRTVVAAVVGRGRRMELGGHH